MLKPGYAPFYVRARRWVPTRSVNGERFDLAHQLLPVAMRYPSPLANSRIPYLMGRSAAGSTTRRDSTTTATPPRGT